MGDSCCNKQSIGMLVDFIQSKLGDGAVVESLVVVNEETSADWSHSLRMSKFSNSRGPSAISAHDYVSVSNNSTSAQIEASFFGNAMNQVDGVCEYLLQRFGKDVPMDDAYTEGINLIGFSQGGQFVRGLVERCEGLKVHNVITLGGQHQGVMQVPGCDAGGTNESHSDSGSSICHLMQEIINHGAYLEFVQSRVIQAQYVKDPFNLKEYHEKSIFLADINNESVKSSDSEDQLPRIREEYKERMTAINKLILYRFTEDTTVVPRDSAWFSFFNGTELLPMEETLLYEEDRIGLRVLKESGRLMRLDAPGEHMHIELDWFLSNVIEPFLMD